MRTDPVPRSAPTRKRARALVAVAVLGLLLGACAAAPPPALVTREVPAAAVSDPTRPCTREAAPVPDQAAPTPADVPVDDVPVDAVPVDAVLDRARNTVVLSGGEGVTLPALSRAVDDEEALRELAPGEWLLGANLEVLPGASLVVAAPQVRRLMLSSGAGGFVYVKALGGDLAISGSCVTSWDTAQGRVDTDHSDGRAFLLARDGSRFTVDAAELRHLGYGEAESYGLAWRLAGTGGSITGSIVSHLFYGLYSHQVTGLVVRDNEFHDNVLYGIDPHTESRELTIERNVVHDNGKHGIILAEDCTDSVIRDNVVYRNQHHGIVLYLRSDRNLIEGNESFDNAAQGINVNESADNVVRANRVYGNVESGVGISQEARYNRVEGNEIRVNQQDGLRLVTGSTGTVVRENLIGDNARYGVYIDGDDLDLADNRIFGNRFGIALTDSDALPEGTNELDDNREGEIQQR